MLGNVIHKQRSDEIPKISTRLKELILEKWRENRSGSRLATLVPQDETWKEFWLYASNTKYWCPRLCAIKAFVKIDDIVDAEGLWNMEYGKAVHSVFQTSILPSLRSQLLGAWKQYVPLEVATSRDFEPKIFKLIRSDYFNDIDDYEDRQIVRGWGEKPKVAMPNSKWEYDETKIRMLKYRIVCKLDAILCIDGQDEIFELKTEKEIARDDLDPFMGGAAREDHVNQVSLGMWATGIRKARLCYNFKGVPYFRSSLMEHEIPYDENIINRLKASASQCVEAVQLCDEHKWSVDGGKPFFDDEKQMYEWIDERFGRLQECQLKSKGKPKYCPGRNICFPKGYRRKK